MILDEISDFIPHEYVYDVQQILSEEGIERSVNRIHNAKRGLTADLKVVRALEKIARPIKEELLNDKKFALAEELKLAR